MLALKMMLLVSAGPRRARGELWLNIGLISQFEYLQVLGNTHFLPVRSI